MKLWACIALFCSLAAGQTYVPLGPSLPATCNDGQIFYSTSIPVGWSRCVAGTWESSLNEARIVAMFNSGTCSGYLKSDGSCDTPASGTIPSGLITLILSGSCPAGWTEAAALNGKMLRGTLAANGDVGTTGGNATITPQGTVAAPVFTGSSATTSAVSAGTPAGTNSTGTVTPTGTIAWPVGVPTNGAIAIGTFVNQATATSGNCATTNIAAGTGSTTACKATAPNLTVPAEGHTGSLTSPTITWPVGVPTFSGSSSTTSAETFTGSVLSTHTHTLTATGTNSAPAFTGTAVDPSPSYTKVIFCSKN